MREIARQDPLGLQTITTDRILPTAGCAGELFE
jgi:hypothetical protein